MIVKKNTITYNITLFGGDTVEIFEGEEYLEPGYVCFNNKNVDCHDLIKATNNINVNTVGTYTINYQILNNNKVIEEISRTVIVKENPLKNIRFLLNQGNYLCTPLYDEFIDPGYTITDKQDKTIDLEVETTGYININKEGTYTLDYTITMEKLQKTISRTVKVTDLNIKSVINETKPTNQDITINLTTNFNEFMYVELPNGSKIYQNNITYTVNTNGIYNFKIYNIYNTYKEYTIEITNIDKVAPTLSCILKGNDVSINASDNNNNNLQYSYSINNNSSYTNYTVNNFYEVTGLPYEVFAKVKDEAGNIKETLCSNELVIGNGYVPYEYTDSLGYNCLYPYTCFKQLDYSDKYQATSNGVGTIRTSGCLPTSLTIALSGFNIRDNNHNFYNPSTFVNNVLYKNGKIVGYSNESRIKEVASEFNLNLLGTYSKVRSNVEILKNHLRNGYPAIILVVEGCYTGNAHYVTLLGINDKDEVFISDPYSRKSTSYKGCLDNGWISMDYFLSEGSPYQFSLLAK